MEKIKLKWVMNVYNPENNDAREKLSSVFSTGKEKNGKNISQGLIPLLREYLVGVKILVLISY